MRTCAYKRIMNVLDSLHSTHPKYGMGKHLATALDGMGDVFLLKDEEILNALKKYQNELSYDVPHKEEDIETIIEEGSHIASFTARDLYTEAEEE